MPRIWIVAAASFLLFSDVWAATISVTFINPARRGEVFWDMVTDAMQKAADDLNVDLEVLYSGHDRYRMQALGRMVVQRDVRPDYLVIVNEERFGIEVAREADARGVHSLFLLHGPAFDAAAPAHGPLSDLRLGLGSLVPDNAQAGQRMAQVLAHAARDAGLQSDDGRLHMLVIAGDKTTPTALEQVRGMQQGFAAEGDVVVDRLVYGDWNGPEAQKLAAGYLRWAKRNGIRPAGIWAASDTIAFGAINALEKAGMKPGVDLNIASANCDKRTLEAIDNGRIELCEGGLFLAGAWAMVLIRDHADGHAAQSGRSLPHIEVNGLNRNNIRPFRRHIENDRGKDIDFSRFSIQGELGANGYDFSFNAVLRSLMPGMSELLDRRL